MANPYLETMDDDDEVIEIPMKSATKSNPYLDDMEDTPAKPQFQTKPRGEIKGTFQDVPLAGPLSRWLTKGLDSVTPDWMVQNPEKEVVTMDGPKGQEQIMDLPMPSEDMYEGLSQQEQLALYRAYLNHPKTSKDALGGGTYKEQPVPMPMGRDHSSGVTGGVYEGARSTVELGSALAEDQGILPEGTTGKLNEVLPAYRPERLGQKAGSLVGQVMTAAGAENLLYKTGLNIASKLPKVSKAVETVAKTVGHILASTGAAATTFSNPTKETEDGKFETKNQNWFVGNEDAWISEGVDTTSESAAASIIKDRINIALDAAVIAAPVEMLANGGKALGNLGYEMFLERLHGAFSKSKGRQLAMRDFMDQVYDVATAKSPAEKEILNKKLIEWITDPENSKLVLNTGVEGVDPVKMDFSTLQTLRNALAGDESEAAKALLQKFEGEQSNIINKGVGPKTRTAAERPAEALKHVTKQTEEVFNPAGQNTPEIAAGAIRREGQERVGEAAVTFDEATKTFAKVDEEIPYEIATKVKEGNTSLGNAKNDNFAAIPRDKSRIGTSYLKNINSILGRHGDVLPKELMTSILESQDDYGRIIQDVRPKLVKEIERLKRVADSSTGQRPAQLDDLINLKNRIVKAEQDHMEMIGKFDENNPNLANNPGVQKAIQGKREVAEAHKKAEEYYTDVYSPTVNDGVPAKIKEIGKRPKTKFQESTVLDAEAEAVRAGLKKPETSKHLERTLSTPEYGESGGLITKMTEAEKAAETAKLTKKMVEEDTYTTLMDDFFHSNGALKGEGQAGSSFKTLFTGSFNKKKIERLGEIVRSKGDKKVKDGWKAGYMKVFMDNIIPDAGTQVKNDPELLEMGRIVFKDQPEMMDTLSKLIDPAVVNAKDARVRPKGGTLGDALAAGKKDVATLVKTKYGPISRPGTIINAWLGRLMDVTDPQAIRTHFKDSIMADPKVFAQAIQQYQMAKEPGRKARIAFNYLVRANLVNDEDWEDYQKDFLKKN